MENLANQRTPAATLRLVSNVLGSVALIALAGFFYGCAETEAEVLAGSPSRYVETFKVERYTDTHVSTFLGRIRAPKELNLAFELAGKVEWITSTTGQRFKAGEKLGMLDAKRYQLAYADAEQRLAFANKELDRMEKLLEGGSATVAEFDRVQNAALLAGIAWERSRQDLEDSVLYAPFDGKLAAKKVDIGSFVLPGQAVLVFQETGATEVDYHQTETQLSDLLRGLHSGSTTLRLVDGDLNQAGLILKDYATMPDPLSGSYRTTLIVEGFGDGLLFPGAPVQIAVEESLTFLGGKPVEIPANALVTLPSGSFQVWVVADGAVRAEPRAVKLGRVGKRSVEITSGLNLGDRVVTSGSSLLREDSQISIAHEA